MLLQLFTVSLLNAKVKELFKKIQICQSYSTNNSDIFMGHGVAQKPLDRFSIVFEFYFK